MVDMEQIIYPWGIYETSDIEATYISPYLTVRVQQDKLPSQLCHFVFKKKYVPVAVTVSLPDCNVA